ncbi:MAG: HipA N-terminal domain-containing protein [Ignavibacteriales bacterium]|nr:HipA N-terminal domain-containing protein [Ignavibacteriales bacterium]
MKAKVYNFGILCGFLEEIKQNREYKFTYLPDYSGEPVSLIMPLTRSEYFFEEFPPFFDGLLPEGFNLNAMCTRLKIDKNDPFNQLLAVGGDLVGSVTVERDDE